MLYERTNQRTVVFYKELKLLHENRFFVVYRNESTAAEIGAAAKKEYILRGPPIQFSIYLLVSARPLEQRLSVFMGVNSVRDRHDTLTILNILNSVTL